ncbi:ArsR family transcriptional regulator [Leptospira congkakensis]|uniref:ArsR family transcriptional regulator n=1 Tax=Leptospira congkakensis TaxID=2484932 RepID=A0A4Z1ACQ8_9LEPT|nr:metalloregulator ArsR/SmtB family transcription factor [Leptospira congkakensis]TGL92434.1 ArsR family transcriptional regulator [Leptospira congkakensis]TGL93194.1 ArsR family transcriptional regulator [Leptospira congkakensis]TGL96213.1 ArsR family transcriptional regulator [Leptospira congkakensis]
MAQNKKTEFPEKIQKISAFTKLLSHPARLSILEVLAKKQTCVCGEIVEILPLAQSTVSQHLKELKEGGLVKGEVEGTSSCYCIHWENLNLAYQEFSEQIQFLQNYKNQNQGNCCE